VRLNGRDYYLGKWPPGQRTAPAIVQARYDQKIAEWLANGRRLLTPVRALDDGPTLNEVILAYLDHVEQYYRHPDGRPTSEVCVVRQMLRRLRAMYGPEPAAAFDHVALETFRAKLISEGLARTRINKDVCRVRALYKWAVSRRLVPVNTYQMLLLVSGLRAGRTEARETLPVQPVPDAHVEAVLAELNPTVRAMVEVQQLTGMRPQEVCLIRTVDLDMSASIWLYRPPHHKNAWRGHARVVAIGPRAQAVLKTRLRLNLQEYLFQPREVVTRWAAGRRDMPTLPLTPARPRGRPKAQRARAPGDHYTTASYGRAVRAACRRAKVPLWSPNRLRHTAASVVRRLYGLEAAQVLLGHARADVTEIYAERDLNLAVRIAAEVG
jgi:integrase